MVIFKSGIRFRVDVGGGGPGVALLPSIMMIRDKISL